MANFDFQKLRMAYLRWCEFHDSINQKIDGPGAGFRAFIEDDLNRYTHSDNKSLEVSRTTETRLDMLLSPHWYALLKAYNAKRKQYGEGVRGEGQ